MCELKHLMNGSYSLWSLGRYPFIFCRTWIFGKIEQPREAIFETFLSKISVPFYFLPRISSFLGWMDSAPGLEFDSIFHGFFLKGQCQGIAHVQSHTRSGCLIAKITITTTRKISILDFQVGVSLKKICNTSVDVLTQWTKSPMSWLSVLIAFVEGIKVHSNLVM